MAGKQQGIAPYRVARPDDPEIDATTMRLVGMLVSQGLQERAEHHLAAAEAP
jgi:hypothetical protein